MPKHVSHDITKLTIPISMVVGILSLAISGTWWASTLSSNVNQVITTIEKADRRVANVEMSINAAFADQRSIVGRVDVVEERQRGIAERQSEYGTRLLQLENWQRVLNAERERVRQP